MSVLRLMAAFMFVGLLTGCIFEDIQKLKNDTRLLRDYLKASPVPTHCSQPGRDQDIVCNYRLVIWNVSGEVYRGHVDPKLVEEGIRACEEFRTKSANQSYNDKTQGEYDTDLVSIMQQSKCPTKDNYRYNVYEFKIADPIPDSPDPVELENVPHGPYMKKGHIGQDTVTHLPLAR